MVRKLLYFRLSDVRARSPSERKRVSRPWKWTVFERGTGNCLICYNRPVSVGRESKNTDRSGNYHNYYYYGSFRSVPLHVTRAVRCQSVEFNTHPQERPPVGFGYKFATSIKLHILVAFQPSRFMHTHKKTLSCSKNTR